MTNIDTHWASLKSALLAEGGYDRLVEFTSYAHVFSLQERAVAMRREREHPDYGNVAPADLQARIARELACGL